MSLFVTLLGLAVLLTGMALVWAAKQRPTEKLLLTLGRLGLGVGTVVLTLGACWLVVAGV